MYQFGCGGIQQFCMVLAVVVLSSACKQLGIRKTLYEGYPTVVLVSN